MAVLDHNDRHPSRASGHLKQSQASRLMSGPNVFVTHGHVDRMQVPFVPQAPSLFHPVKLAAAQV